MRVISRAPLTDFWVRHPQARAPLAAWHQLVEHGDWQSFVELRATFPSADQVGRLTVFNVGGNRFRVVTRVEYGLRRIYVRRVLTHDEYDRQEWKEDPWF